MYTMGIFFLPITVIAIVGILSGKRSKGREHGSNPSTGGAVLLIVMGLAFGGGGLYNELQGMNDPVVLGVDFSQFFGDLTPLAQLALNPFFLMGMLILIGGANSLMVGFQLRDEGILTIPYDFRVVRHRSSKGSTSWEVHYAYLDEYRGEASFTVQQYQQLERKLRFLTSGAAQPQDAARVFLVQYLESDPTYHRFWETKKIPKTLLNANKVALTEELRQQGKPVQNVAVVEEDEYFMTADDHVLLDELPSMG